MQYTTEQLNNHIDTAFERVLPGIYFKMAHAFSDSYMHDHPDAWRQWEFDPLDDFIENLFQCSPGGQDAFHFIQASDPALFVWLEYNLGNIRNHLNTLEANAVVDIVSRDEAGLLCELLRKLC